MIRDITLGQYYPEYSIIHKLDPRLKIVAILFYIASLFVVKDFCGYLLVMLALGIFISLSKVPLRFILRGLKPIMIIIMFTFLLNMFMTSGEILWQWKFLKITQEGIYNAVFMALRLVFLILGSSMLTLTTKPIKLTDGIESLLKPFKKMGLPTHELAMMMTIALRFIPTLLEETDKIMKAQMARGADFETGSIFRRAKAMVPILVPLFVGAFRIAQDLAMAMEARCYRGGEGRTKLNALKFKRKDAVAALIMAVYFALAILDRVFLEGLDAVLVHLVIK
ncbi:MAG: energy-coupling factor transporter transmembrane protein EcfT [Clostridiales Family XIII bacterium]|jgi:energy-coupling factor transport system permease protein|nr:energy-coupling factor transporter transmembrane protein EcfT [Clostridiales Family XIII bacterium]